MEFIKTKKYKFELRDFHYFLLAEASHTQPPSTACCGASFCFALGVPQLHAPMTSE